MSEPPQSDGGDVWVANAARWTRAVRGGRIASRAAGTDAAILQAILARRPARLLDAGCGEGWLVRALRTRLPGCRTTGIDAVPALIAAARTADPGGDYRVLDYAAWACDPAAAGGPFDVILFNFALFDADLAPVLATARQRLASGGAVLIQTVPPVSQADEGWRTEDFAAFGPGGWQPLRWYARSRSGWTAALSAAGLDGATYTEPIGAQGQPLSLVLLAVAT